jgi:hypothetical protein
VRRARAALATLPWVEQDSVKIDVVAHEARFKLKDRAAWNENAIRSAFKDQDFAELTVTNMPP